VTLGFIVAGIAWSDVAEITSSLTSKAAGGIALTALWFLGFAILALAGVFGGALAETAMSRSGLHTDPFHLFRWYAGLFAVLSNWLLLLLFFFLLNGALLAIPFVLVPLLGIEASRRIFQFGSVLLRPSPDGLGPGTSAEPSAREIR